jgi:hypothetical protein
LVGVAPYRDDLFGGGAVNLDFGIDESEREFPDAPALSLRSLGQEALEAIYDGADFDEWDALVDQLEARGLRVVTV